MLNRLSNWILRLLRGKKGPLLATRSGDVTHEWYFETLCETARARHISRVGSKESTIQYFLSQHDVEGRDDFFVYIVEDVIHELSHWADEDDWTKHNGVEKHWKTWHEVILREIEYVHDEVEILW